MHLLDQPPNSTFTTTELARLAVYRAAVKAGFYTDWDGSAASTDTHELAWLGGADYPFTTDERQRLDRLRMDLAEGRYADDRPPAPAPSPQAAEVADDQPPASPPPAEGRTAAEEHPESDSGGEVPHESDATGEDDARGTDVAGEAPAESDATPEDPAR